MKQDLDRRLVAVMFTDMVGYTALFQTDERLAMDKRDRYVKAVERCHGTFGGTIVQRLGDGSMSMFPGSLVAVQAAVEIQPELAAHDVPVRIGIHVGEVIVEPHSLIGDAVNVASRIESFAVPGGVMLSDAARDQIRNRTDVAVVGLGRFRLKNVGRPVELYAVSADGIVVPDERALEGKGERFAGLPGNIPQPVTSLVGRAADLQSLIVLASEHRVVTITGPGGVGKTRMLIEVGRMLGPEYLDRIAFVPLADVATPEGFIPALAGALDVKEATGRTLGEGIVSLIGDGDALLLLDNLEQVVLAAPDVARLVESCPQLRIVTTSRTPLRIAAEREYPLAPLALPSGEDSTDSFMAYPAIALFVDRALSSRATFEMTAANAPAVAAVCRRLDGLPLALELAAARLRLLSPEALLERLDRALTVLTSGPRDSPERHQTLRATIEWSHSLLDESEQRLFRRMAVFAGGCTVADLEAVCAEPGETILDELESLVDKALVQADGKGDRLRMLQTIGEYARERLVAVEETGEIALRHARRYAELAREIRDGIEGTEQRRSLERGIADEGNVQAALDTLLAAAKDGDAAASEMGMQLCGDLWLYWHIRGKNLTAREYAASFLEVEAGGAPTAGRAAVLVTAGLASDVLGQFDRANDEWAKAYRIATTVDADRELCIGAFLSGFGLFRFDLPAGIRLMEEGIERSRAVGFAWAEGFASSLVGILHALAGDLETANERYAHGLRIQQVIGDQEGAGLSLGGLAGLAAGRGDLAGALELYGQSLAAYEAIGDRAEEARIHAEMAWTHVRAGTAAAARQRFLDSVRAYTDVASVRGVGLSLIGLAATESIEDQYERAVQIAAAAEVYADQEGIVNVYADRTTGREFVDRARASLSEDDVTRATEMGRRLTIKQVVDLVTTATSRSDEAAAL